MNRSCDSGPWFRTAIGDRESELWLGEGDVIANRDSQLRSVKQTPSIAILNLEKKVFSENVHNCMKRAKN